MQMNLEVTHWEKHTSLWLPDFPKWTTQFSYTTQVSKILRKYPHFLLLITCWIPELQAQQAMQGKRQGLLGYVQFLFHDIDWYSFLC